VNSKPDCSHLELYNERKKRIKKRKEKSVGRRANTLYMPKNWFKIILQIPYFFGTRPYKKGGVRRISQILSGSKYLNFDPLRILSTEPMVPFI